MNNRLIDLYEFLKTQELSSLDFLRDFKGKMFDSYFDINNMVELELDNMKKRNEERQKTIIIEADRRAAEEKELPTEIFMSLKSFQSLVNMLYERSARMCFERSMKILLNQFRKLINKYNSGYPEDSPRRLTMDNKDKLDYEDLYNYQKQVSYENVYTDLPALKVKLDFNEQKEFFVTPNLSIFDEKLRSFANNLKTKLVIECLRAKEIGPARASGCLDVNYRLLT